MIFLKNLQYNIQLTCSYPDDLRWQGPVRIEIYLRRIANDLDLLPQQTIGGTFQTPYHGGYSPQSNASEGVEAIQGSCEHHPGENCNILHLQDDTDTMQMRVPMGIDKHFYDSTHKKVGKKSLDGLWVGN